MPRASEIVIPARFLLTMGHFVTSILAFYGRATAVAAALPASAGTAAYEAAFNSVTTCLAISMVCFIVQFYGIFSGATIFRMKLGVFHSLTHFIGGVLTAWYLIDSLGYLSLW